ncbi:hypothetical protein ACXN5S_02870 [Pseudoroseicyclus sp. H15]
MNRYFAAAILLSLGILAVAFISGDQRPRAGAALAAEPLVVAPV